MLNAILYSKARSHDDEDGLSIRWSSLFRENEDFVTATLFERLSYLPDPLSWEILCRTFRLPHPHYRLARLDRLEFWPSWGRIEYEGRVEPDVFLSFLLGEPETRVDLIIEAKHDRRHNSRQSADQWISQQRACLHAQGEDSPPDARVYAAIGGLGRHARDRFEQLREEVTARAPDCAASFAMAGAGWHDMAAALAEVAPREHGEHGRILEDAIEALSLFGYRTIVLPDTLLRLAGTTDAERSLRRLQHHHGE